MKAKLLVFCLVLGINTLSCADRPTLLHILQNGKTSYAVGVGLIAFSQSCLLANNYLQRPEHDVIREGFYFINALTIGGMTGFAIFDYLNYRQQLNHYNERQKFKEIKDIFQCKQ